MSKGIQPSLKVKVSKNDSVIVKIKNYKKNLYVSLEAAIILKNA